MTDEKPYFAEGGMIGPPKGSVPFQLSRGSVLMSYASYKALGPAGRAELFPNTDIEVVFTMDDVRRAGIAAIERLQQELDEWH